MLAYFPTIYPGELLYSVLARNFIHTGLPPSILVNDELLGKQYAIPSFDLPFGISKLASLIPKHNDFTATQLLKQLTLFRYLIAFATPKFAKRAYQSVLKGTVVNWYVKLGMAAFRVKRVTCLRFCPLCNADMLKQYGELFWKREFQLPSVVVCTIHHNSLYNSTVNIKFISRHVFFAADPTNCIVNAESRLVNESINHIAMQRLISIAQRSNDLIEMEAQYKTHGEWTTYYRRKLEETGFATFNGKVKQSKLRNALFEFYSDTFQNVSEFYTLSKLNWLAGITRKHRHAFHPLHHLLLEEFLANQKCELPFGTGPWICKNPLAEHYGNPVISKYRQHSNHGHQVAVFECQCGYIYTQWLDTALGTIGPKRFLSFGPLLPPVLKKYLAESLSLREIARRIQLDPKTVIKLATDIGLEHSWSLKGIKAQSHKKHSSKSAQKTAQTPLKPKLLSKLNWKEIDIQLKRLVHAEVRRIYKISPPIKVTLAVIERGLHKPGWIARRKKKLPLTTLYLESKIEKHADFRTRRLIWAVKELQKYKRPLYPSHITRMAGIRHTALDLAHSSINSYLN